jgi:Alpha/beta hydrolase
MSTLTLADVIAAQPAPYQRAAIAWAALAEDLDNAYEQVIVGLKKVDRGADGEAARAAIRKILEQSHRLSNSCNPARRISDALQRHAYALNDLHHMIQGVATDARANGLVFNATTGQLIAPPTVLRTDEPAYWQPAMNKLRGELSQILARAGQLDEETAAAIHANLPSPVGDGFGAMLAWYVDRNMVAQQQGRTPAEVHAWWLSLSPEQQEQVIHDYPDLVGWLNGVPATDRDRANRVNLENQLTTLQAQEADLQRRIEETKAGMRDVAGGRPNPAAGAPLNVLMAQLTQNQASQAGLREVRDKLSQYTVPPAYLMGIDGSGDGKAIVALGDPDTARHTAVFVPGINTDLGDIGGDMNRVNNLQDAADLLTPAANDVSVIYWLGYDTPGTLDALSYGASKDGAKAFTPFVDGLRSTHQPSVDGYHVTAVGHSYGSTVIAESALSGNLHVDDIVTAGSPGMHTDHAADLHIDPRHVWGGLADGDPVGGAGGSVWWVHGEEPTDEDFGDNRYVVDTEGHSAYWTPNTESLANQAAIVVGRYNQVTLEYGSPPPP